MKDYGPPTLMRMAGFSLQGTDKSGPKLPATSDFDPSKLTATECAEWLTRMLPRLSWNGAEQDFAVIHNRVVISNGIFKQYRIYGGGAYPARTYQVRQLPLQAIASDAISPIRTNPGIFSPSAKYWYFTIAGNTRTPWRREYEVWDEQDRRVASRGTFMAERVRFNFSDPEGAAQARAVFHRLAALASRP